MAESSPFRNRANVPQFLFTPLSGKISWSQQPTPPTTPRGSLSPVHSRNLLSLSSHGGQNHSRRRSTCAVSIALKQRVKRMLRSPLLWILVVIAISFYAVAVSYRSQKLQLALFTSKAAGLTAKHFDPNLQFILASNPKIHYVGRWTATPNQQRKDGTFPGVYFDLKIYNTSSLFLSLHNTPQNVANTSHSFAAKVDDQTSLLSANHLSFSASSAWSKVNAVASPISLLVRVDQEDYILLPNSSALVTVCTDLDSTVMHDIRVIAPMILNDGMSMIQLNGIYLDKGGKLLGAQESGGAGAVDDEDGSGAETPEGGELGDSAESWTALGHEPLEDSAPADQARKRLLETVTDSPGFTGLRRGHVDSDGERELLAGVMGWEYLLGEMFNADHVTIGVEGMCLSQDCVGGTGQPFGLGDVFFRSGPVGSPHFEHLWTFQSYVPHAILMNVGASDWASFEEHSTQYGKSTWDFGQAFEDAYVSLVKAIRQLAYAKSPAQPASEVDSRNVPASVPIFIMRPFGGQLEHFVQGAVRRLRKDGDQAVFWLDTSGWLDEDETTSEDRDFYEDVSVSPPRLRLTEAGNQRASVFLHMHLCRYLVNADGQCAFLPPEVYEGEMFDPSAAAFDRYLEAEKETKLKEYFWGS